MYNQHTKGMVTTRHRSLVERGRRKALLDTLHTHKNKMSKKKPIFTNLKKRFEHIELPAKLLDYFWRSNKSNINQTYSHHEKLEGSVQWQDAITKRRDLRQCVYPSDAHAHQDQKRVRRVHLNTMPQSARVRVCVRVCSVSTFLVDFLGEFSPLGIVCFVSHLCEVCSIVLEAACVVHVYVINMQLRTCSLSVQVSSAACCECSSANDHSNIKPFSLRRSPVLSLGVTQLLSSGLGHYAASA